MSSTLPPLPPPDRGTIRIGREDIIMGHSDEAMLAYGQACAAAEHARMNAVLAAQSAAHHREVQEQVAAERERCAKVCEDKAAMFSPSIDVRALTWAESAHYCAAAIRARGET